MHICVYVCICQPWRRQQTTTAHNESCQFVVSECLIYAAHMLTGRHALRYALHTVKRMRILTCIEHPGSAAGVVTQHPQVNGGVGSLSHEECYLLNAVIREPLADLAAARGVGTVTAESDGVTDLCQRLWPSCILQIKAPP